MPSGIRGDQLLPGTAACNIPETVELTRHAVAAGAKGCVMLPPFYYKGVSDEGLFRFYASVIEGVGRCAAAGHPLPHPAGLPACRSAHDLIDRLLTGLPGHRRRHQGQFGRAWTTCARWSRGFPASRVLAGADPLLLPLLQMGGAGCITATSNLRSTDLRVIWDHWADAARAGRRRRRAGADQRLAHPDQLLCATAHDQGDARALARRSGLAAAAPAAGRTERCRSAAVWAEMARLGG